MASNTSFFGAIKAPVVSITSAVATTAEVVDIVAKAGKVQAQNLLAETLLENHKSLIEAHGQDVSTKLEESVNFFSKLPL